MRYTFLFSFLLVIITNPAFAQASLVRGNIVDAASGQPVAFASVQISGTGLGTISDENGFYSIPEVPTGDWVLQVRFLGYAPIDTAIAVEAGRIYYRRIALVPDAVELETIDISARRERDRSSVNMSARRLESEDFAQLPNIGGTPDLAQYLTVLPGIVSTGDLGGQLFNRGGSPSQQKVLLDGLTIFNPFHSIGLFSVFETEAIQSADVLTGGFQANHGGRLSAILDIKTRAGHQKGWHGLVSASPFQARSLIEGPIVKSTDEKPGSVSLLVTGKYGYLDQTSPALYPNAANQSILSQDALGSGEEGLPYSYQDLYGKVSFNGSSG
ncbi:MAG: carboxypeptidase-like regulatory domain-containing protein, partial [Saprospiraceae bacterium]|nr:carboxypeptidase-like regulatory domain-containing protein [Saprospiraceae bacterium]